ncbi:MAG: STAS domain-containing protein [Actinomycetota bacterium]|nr:STAS domain-containing protein [Actinomycetota bacterium]
MAGEIDLASEGQFERSLEEVFHFSSRPVIVDLRAVAFIDINGVRSLIKFWQGGYTPWICVLLNKRQVRLFDVCWPLIQDDAAGEIDLVSQTVEESSLRRILLESGINSPFVLGRTLDEEFWPQPS